MAEVHHAVDGPRDAPVLVLSNSLGTTLEVWRPQLSALADRHRVVRYDHRGHGASPTPPGPYEIDDLGRDALSLLDRLGCERVSFCGTSIGGMAGIWLASEAPERVERLVLCCTSAHVPPAAAWLERAEKVRGADSVEVVADDVFEKWLTPAFREREPGTATWLWEMLGSSPPDGYAACCEALARLDLRERLERITAPTLVIAGADDRAIPAEHSERIARAVPGARIEILSPAAHLATVEQANAVTKLILDHLDRKERPDG